MSDKNGAMGRRLAMVGIGLGLVVVTLLTFVDRSTFSEEALLLESIPAPTAIPTVAPTAVPTATATPTVVPTPTEIPLRSISLAFTGELLSHGGVIDQARRNGTPETSDYDYTPMFAAVAPLLKQADLALCHQETPISSSNTALSGYPVFNAPREIADGIAAAGWDGCSVSSNHAIDKGFQGVTETLDELDRAGLGHTGTARTEEERANPPIYDIGGISVGHMSWTYGTNGIPVPSSAPFSVNVTGVEAIKVEAAALRARGAEWIVLSIQWGNEYQRSPSSTQSAQARELLASPDIDLIIGAHVHVVQPAEVIDGELVLYGLGNFLSNQSPQSCNSCPPGSQDGMIFTVTVEEALDGSLSVMHAQVTPTFVDRSTYEIIPVAQRLADPDAALADTLRASWERTNEAVYLLDIDPTFLGIDPLS